MSVLRDEKKHDSKEQLSVEVIEHNGWEGETWHFLHEIDSEYSKGRWESLLRDVNKRLSKIFERCDTTFEIGSELLTETEKKFLLKRPSTTNYMNEYNESEESLSFEDFQEFAKCSSKECAERTTENCYKGSYSFYCSCNVE